MSHYIDAFFAALKPEPSLTVSEWADSYRVLDQSASAESGQWRTSRTPYLREIMDCLSTADTVTQQVVFMKGAQVGATECGNNWLGYIIHHAPGPILYVMPTTEMIKRASKQRISPLLENSPVLKEKIASPRSRDSGNTLMMKEFDGGALVMTGANSAVGLRSMPARFLFMDEIDAYPGDADGEGDPIALAMKRTSTFKRNRKIFMPSTPTIKNASHVERFFLRSDQRYYFVPCPHCDEYQTITWKKIIWFDNDPQTVHMVCEVCGAIIKEQHKTEMLSRGEWRPTAVSADPQLRGYHLSALYSPVGWYGWSDAVRDFLDAKGNPELTKTFVNTTLGETWEEAGDQSDPQILMNRREKYPAEVPAKVKSLTMGVDVQADRIEFEVVGWGDGEESWSIDYQILFGDPVQGEIWDDLRDCITHEYEHESGSMMPISFCVIDSGYLAKRVLEFVRESRLFFVRAGKGIAGARPIVESRTSRAQRIRAMQKRNDKPELVGVDEAKLMLHRRLSIASPGPGYLHFPDDRDDEWFAQLTAEKLMTKYQRGFPIREWVKTRPRNEALDCRVYAMAAYKLMDYARKPRALTPESHEMPQKTERKLPPTRTSHGRKFRI